MTIEEMRRAMREKVVPEEVVPQNVVNRLIDADAEPPKLDAFAFLMRLRTLGIGSADFLNLLEGCDAPESVINKIKQNPAMNLQGLVLTLESSGLTTDDYTRMLLTARQVWERTLTLRLERSEQLSHDVKYESAEDAAEDLEEVTSDTPEEPAEEYDDAAEEDYYYDEDLQEMSFTAVFNKINKEIKEGILTVAPETEREDKRPTALEEDKTSEDEPTVLKAEKASENEQVTPQSEKTREDKQAAKLSADVSETTASAEDKESDSFASAFDKIKSEKRRTVDEKIVGRTATGTILIGTGTVNDTTKLVGIDEELLRKDFADLTEETEETSGNSEEPSDNYDDYGDETDEEEPSRVYHKGAIIGGAVGAAVLVGAGLVIGQYTANKDARAFHYAADHVEIFNKIYHAYTDEEEPITGGTKAYAMESGDSREIFGDLLIGGGDDNKSFTSYSGGGVTYTLSEDAIAVSKTENGKATSLEALVPPEKARFVALFDDNGKLYAMFSGQQSGFMRISDGKAELTVRQDGVLTDYDMSDGKIRLGTVYTPSFGHTFEITELDMYLPKTGTSELQPISAQDVIMSETNGYSYGVSAEYSAENGELQDVCAVIGDPVAASADGRFALNGDEGILLKANDDKFSVEHTDKISRAAFYENGCAVVGEASEDGSLPDIMMFDTSLMQKANLTGLSEKITGMWFDGGVLKIECGSLVCVDCAKLEEPKRIHTTAGDGAVIGNSALTFEVTDTAVVITRCDLENGSVKKTAEFSKKLPAEQLAEVKFGGAETAVINGKQSGAAYSYFDGVSVVSEYVAFDNNGSHREVSMFDDKTGFTAAWVEGGVIKAACDSGVQIMKIG